MKNERKTKKTQPDFKAKVAIEALKGVKTIQQIAREFEIYPIQVSESQK